MTSRRFGAFITVLLATVLAVSSSMTSVVGAQETPSTIRDFEGYPLANGVVPEGCTAQGADLLEGERFSVNGGPAITNFRAAPVTLGDTVTMSWDSIAAGCEAAMVTLSMKITSFPQFEITDNQFNALSTSCSPAGPTCESLGNALSLELIAAGSGFTCFQVDAHLGPALNVVGPDGSYYGTLNGRHNVLIAAKNGGQTPCTIVPCLTPGIDAPASSTECREGSSQSLVITTTTAAPTTTVPVTVPTEAPTSVAPTTQAPTTAPTTSEPASVNTGVGGDALATDQPAVTLPRTGLGRNGAMAWFGWFTVIVGALIVYGRRS